MSLVAVACGDAGEPSSGAGGIDAIGTATWQLSAATVDGAPLTLVPAAPVTLARSETGVGGRSACNSYFGSINGHGDVIAISQLGMTEMACPDPGVMELETAYLAALARVTAATRSGERLTLAGPGIELVFAPEPTLPDAALAGTTWVLETLVSGDVASSVVAGSVATLTIVDGQAGGSTGCNRLGGAVEVTGGRLGPVPAMTEMACEGLADQEAHVLAVLSGKPTVAIEGDLLTLTLDDGSGLVYRAQR